MYLLVWLIRPSFSLIAFLYACLCFPCVPHLIYYPPLYIDSATTLAFLTASLLFSNHLSSDYTGSKELFLYKQSYIWRGRESWVRREEECVCVWEEESMEEEEEECRGGWADWWRRASLWAVDSTRTGGRTRRTSSASPAAPASAPTALPPTAPTRSSR